MASIFDNHTIVIFVSIIWGFGLAILFRQVCQNDQCVIVKVPNILNTQNNIIFDKNTVF